MSDCSENQPSRGKWEVSETIEAHFERRNQKKDPAYLLSSRIDPLKPMVAWQSKAG